MEFPAGPTSRCDIGISSLNRRETALLAKLAAAMIVQ